MCLSCCLCKQVLVFDINFFLPFAGFKTRGTVCGAQWRELLLIQLNKTQASLLFKQEVTWKRKRNIFCPYRAVKRAFVILAYRVVFNLEPKKDVLSHRERDN